MDHSLTPPPELVKQWEEDWHHGKVKHIELEPYIAAQAAQWGADLQLEADAEWLDQYSLDASHLTIIPTGKGLVETMRPKPPTLKERSLALIDRIQAKRESWLVEELDVVRRALEALPDD